MLHLLLSVCGSRVTDVAWLSTDSWELSPGCTILLTHTSLILPPLVDTLEQGSKLGMDSTIPQHWCFLTSQGTDGSPYLPTLGICTTWVLAGFVCLYIRAGCLPSTISLHFLVRFLVPQNPVGHSAHQR